jgi:hypothetical protein
MVSKILIEYEEVPNRENLMSLTVDGHLIAENLTAEKMQGLIFEIMERIAVLDVGENALQYWEKELGPTRVP